jgi:hypothetical protein
VYLERNHTARSDHGSDSDFACDSDAGNSEWSYEHESDAAGPEPAYSRVPPDEHGRSTRMQRFAESAKTNRCPADMLRADHLKYGPASRLVIAGFKGGNCAWQTRLCASLSQSKHGSESGRLAAAIVDTVRTAGRLRGCRKHETHGVRGSGPTCINRRLQAACQWAPSSRGPLQLRWPKASSDPAARATAQAHPGLCARLRTLIESLPPDAAGGRARDPLAWVVAVQADIDGMVKSKLWKSRRRYCTLQPARSAGMARAPIGKWSLSEWGTVTVSQLMSVSPDENGMFQAAVASLGAHAEVPAMGRRLAVAFGVTDPGDPRLWSCWWCQAHLASADATHVFFPKNPTGR